MMESGARGNLRVVGALLAVCGVVLLAAAVVIVSGITPLQAAAAHAAWIAIAVTGTVDLGLAAFFLTRYR